MDKPGGRLRALILLLAVSGALLFEVRPALRGDTSASPDPWTKAEVVTPAQVAAELRSGTARKTKTVCVGFDFMYRSAHIPGAIYLGPGREAAGIERLKTWAASTRKNEPVLLYCGCCPMAHCPNLRPAFRALKDLGFTRLKIIDIPNDFARDWKAKGLPTEKRQ